MDRFRPLMKPDSLPKKSKTDELDGLVETGMKKEALAKVRKILKEPRMDADFFGAAMKAILVQTEKLKPWTKLVESAYPRLPSRKRPSVRFWMLAFYCSTNNYEAARQFIPRRFTGVFMELVLALETLMGLGDMVAAEKIAAKLPRAIRRAEDDEDPFWQVMLANALAKFFARDGAWDGALQLWELVQQNDMFCRDSVTGMVEIHIARALRAIQSGLQLVANFKKNHDPELETTLPGNEKTRLEEAEKEFRRLQKKLEKVLPEKRRQELGI